MIISTLLVSFTLYTLSSVGANSVGVGIPCDVDLSYLGSTDRVQSDTRVMWWALVPEFAGDAYTLRTGDGAIGDDPTTYVPGQWFDIYIRSNEIGQQFTGLVMYAEDSDGDQIGEWYVPPGSSFHTESGCVTHNNANPKNYLNRFKLRIPESTGRIEIKALVKYGLAFPVLNSAFYWPNDAHLVLNEAEVVDRSWYVGEAGQSCDTVCYAYGGSCDLTLLQDVGNDKDALYEATRKFSTCHEPLMAGCAASSPSISSDGCFYHDEDCAEEEETSTFFDCYYQACPENENYCVDPGGCCYQNVDYDYDGIGDSDEIWCVNDEAYMQPQCSFNKDNSYAWSMLSTCEDYTPSSSSDTSSIVREPEAITCEAEAWDPSAKRLCACSGASDGIVNDVANLNGASRSGSGTTWVFLMIVSIFFMNQGRVHFKGCALGVVFLLVLCLLPSSQAHNWLTSPARGNEAKENNGYNGYTSPPCPQKGTRIHAQVQAGQKFPIEWASGHGFGSYTYFVVLAAEDEAMMNDHTMALLDDYLDNAPSSALDYMSEYKAHHVIPHGDSPGASCDEDVTETFVWVPSHADSEGARPTEFRYGACEDCRVYTKVAADTTGDIRAQYTNDDYPWIISVHKFFLHEDRPEEMDLAMMEIPEGYASGQYIVQYLWSGYYDCVDVNVIDEESTDIWGYDTGETGYDRVDHCQYIDTYEGFTTDLPSIDCQDIYRGDGVGVCESLCDSQAGCTGIQVIPYSLDSVVTDIGMFTEHSHIPDGCTTDATNTEDLHLCYILTSGTPEVGAHYLISSDPEDPVFYSTCFEKVGGWSFDQACDTCAPAVIEPGFIFGDQCMSCTDMRNNAITSLIPYWEWTDDCRHCDATQG